MRRNSRSVAASRKIAAISQLPSVCGGLPPRRYASASTSISPERWLETSLVIDFKGFHTDSETKSLAAALILNFLIKKLGRQLAVTNDIQPLKMVLCVDKAHLLLPKEHKAGLLSQLARQGRS